MGGSWQTSKETTLLSQETHQTQFSPNELPTFKMNTKEGTLHTVVYFKLSN